MKLKTIMLTIAILATTMIGAMAQPTNASFGIKGDINIKYNTRTAAIVPGVVDVYTFNINMGNRALFVGTITDRPQIISGMFSKEVTQKRMLTYNIDLSLFNPKNISETKKTGRMYGEVDVDSDGTYRYDQGKLVVDILPSGKAAGFTSKFSGTAVGKPMNRPANWLDTAKLKTMNITRSVGGKSTTVLLKRYDKMDFNQCILAAGPVGNYQAVTLNGSMIYDYDKECWFVNNVTAQYVDDSNVVKIDRIGGTIKWIEGNNGGEYQFDVRVNEPLAAEAATFDNSTSDESAFFESDSTIPALVGTMKYTDTKSATGKTLASSVKVDLNGHLLSKQQTMVMCKMIMFAAVVPMNAD